MTVVEVGELNTAEVIQSFVKPSVSVNRHSGKKQKSL